MSMFKKYHSNNNCPNYEPETTVSKFGIVKIYLYVPYEYKNQAKELGARFDGEKKKWYTFGNNPNMQKVIDIFHEINFTNDKKMKKTIINEKQRHEMEKKSWAN